MDPEIIFNNAKIALENILEAIQIGSKENLEKYLGTISLEYISSQDQVFLLDVILEQIYKFGENELVDFIFRYFDKVNDTTTVIPTLSLYLMRNGLQDHLLTFIGSNINSSFEEVIMGINQAPVSQASYEGCLNAERVFGKPDVQILLKLDVYLFTDPKDLNVQIYNYVRMRMGEQSKPISRPDWVVSGTEGDDIPLSFELDIPDFPDVKLMSPEEFADKTIKVLIEQGHKEAKKDEQFTFDMIASQYAISTLEHKIIRVNDYNQNILAPKVVGEATIPLIEVDTLNDEVLFMLFGPNNTSFDQKIQPIPDGNICERFGGCRMLICNCAEAENNVDEEEVDYGDFGVPEADWYTGVCQQCMDKIPFRHYALRRPLKLGGWLGCFCSIKCIQKNWKSDRFITPTLLGRMMDYLNKIGIQDRRYSNSNQIINT